jgi:glycosyltransferase involved in cell wall biosynthesis
MTIVFVHNKKAFLPETELEACTQFFGQYGINCVLATKKEAELLPRQVEWFFMGVDHSPRRPGIIKIHEYSSSSLPPLRRWKDRIKRYYNTQPDFRLFLNEYVQEQFNFRDGVPVGFRDMGITQGLLQGAQQVVDKEYDFIYCGSVTKDIRFDRILDRFLPGAPMAGHTILILSMNFQHLAEKYGGYRNIVFKGPVGHEEVGQYLRKARFAINYKPDIEPHNHQTVTKLLEYAACRIPIITSDLAWVRSFGKQYGGRFFYLAPDFSNFTMEGVQQFSFQFPDLSSWTWEQQLRGSGVLEFLRQSAISNRQYVDF